MGCQVYQTKTTVSLTYTVLFGIRRAPSSSYYQNSPARELCISNHDVEQLCAVIREERAEELARACISSNAARQRRAVAVLKRTLTKKRV